MHLFMSISAVTEISPIIPSQGSWQDSEKLTFWVLHLQSTPPFQDQTQEQQQMPKD